MKFNDNVFAEEIRKQALEKRTYKINIYLIENNITTTKFHIARTLSSGDVVIQTTNIKEVEKLKEEDS